MYSSFWIIFQRRTKHTNFLRIPILSGSREWNENLFSNVLTSLLIRDVKYIFRAIQDNKIVISSDSVGNATKIYILYIHWIHEIHTLQFEKRTEQMQHLFGYPLNLECKELLLVDVFATKGATSKPAAMGRRGTYRTL